MKSTSTIISVTLLTLAGSSMQAALAQSKLLDTSPHFGESGWEVSVGAGLFSASENLTIYKRDDDDFEDGFFVPVEASYIGERFYFKAEENDGLILGYTLAQNQNWAVDAILSPRFSGLFDNDLLEDLDDRDPDLHGGLRYSAYFDDSVFHIDLSRDIISTHDGYTISAAYAHEWQLRNWLITGTASAAYVSDDMVDYYFGVDANEATAQFPVYTADSSFITGLVVDAEYPLNENWTFNASLAHLMLGDEIEDSPISVDDNQISAVSTSVRYHF